MYSGVKGAFFLKKLDGVFNWVGDICGNISIFFGMIMTLLVFANIASRLLLNAPIVGSYELIELAKGITVFFAFAWAQRCHSYINIVMLIRRFPRRMGDFCFATGAVLAVALAVCMSIGGFQFGLQNIRTGSTTGVWRIPYYPFAFIGCAAWALCALLMGIDAIKAILAIKRLDYSEKVREHWL